ncbi:MAG: PEP-CTERM sorting domain-containing protein [Verrucomicrobia bacterium]|nr:PEP-CTERM sorting domain-containing protein [Verrucomicrobiota bacterium]
MKSNHFKLISLLALAGLTGAQAGQFTYSSAAANNLVGFNGQALVATDQVEIGTYVNGTFTSIHSGNSNANETYGPGFFSHADVAKQDTSAIAEQQLAIRWNHAASSTWAILYLDITTVGLDTAIKDQWTVKSGDGGGVDGNTNDVSVSDLTDGPPDFSTLRTGATLVNARFFGTNSEGFTSFEIIPEPSTYAALVGLSALVGTVLYRRR